MQLLQVSFDVNGGFGVSGGDQPNLDGATKSPSIGERARLVRELLRGEEKKKCTF